METKRTTLPLVHEVPAGDGAAPIEPALKALQRSGISVPDPTGVRVYLFAHPDLADRLPLMGDQEQGAA